MSKKKYAKLASLRFTIKDRDAWIIEILASYGYSYKTIAARAFHMARDKVTDLETRRVARVLQKSELRVRDYRDGMNDVGKDLLKRLCGQDKIGDTVPKVSGISRYRVATG